jgi:hypothetical protein
LLLAVAVVVVVPVCVVVVVVPLVVIVPALSGRVLVVVLRRRLPSLFLRKAILWSLVLGVPVGPVGQVTVVATLLTGAIRLSLP